jgi:hypothetical protein
MGSIADPPLSLRLVRGDPVQAGDLTVTPRAWALRVNLGPVHLARASPFDLLVSQQGGEERILILDATRLAQLALLALALAVSLAFSSRSSRRKELAP